MMSFWVVPAQRARSAPCSSPTVPYRASSHIAGALMVIEVFVSASGRPSKSARMSPRWATGTPTRPTSPEASSWSGSYPVWVGRSKATDRPVCPFARLRRKRALVAAADEWPA
ncbi:hypothetical protein PSN01_03128 [Micromonospora saelicesensis]|nr:hypothetical protein PSN01_03128 [Micromonospora saelicesensis]